MEGHPLPPEDVLPLAELFRAHPAVGDLIEDHVLDYAILINGVVHRRRQCSSVRNTRFTDDDWTIVSLADDDVLWCTACFTHEAQADLVCLTVLAVLSSWQGLQNQDVGRFAEATLSTLYGLNPYRPPAQSATNTFIQDVLRHLHQFHQTPRYWEGTEPKNGAPHLVVIDRSEIMNHRRPVRSLIEQIHRDGVHWTMRPDWSLIAVLRTDDRIGTDAFGLSVTVEQLPMELTDPTAAMLLIDLHETMVTAEAVDTVLATI